MENGGDAPHNSENVSVAKETPEKGEFSNDTRAAETPENASSSEKHATNVLVCCAKESLN